MKQTRYLQDDNNNQDEHTDEQKAKEKKLKVTEPSTERTGELT